MKKTILTIVAAAILLPTVAMAKDGDHNENMFSFNGPAQLTNITELTQDTGFLTEKNFIMEGNIIRQISQDEFVFTDGTNQLNIELDDDIQLTAFDEKTKVRIIGEYEGGFEPEAEVKQVILL